MKSTVVGSCACYMHSETSMTSPVTVKVLQICERLVEKVIQVKAHTIACPTAFRCD